MDEDDAVLKLSRRELRKQKLMEYLAEKGRLKPPNPKPYLRDDTINPKKPEAKCGSFNPNKEKENQARGIPRSRLAEKKLHPSAAAIRAPFSSSTNIISHSKHRPTRPASSTKGAAKGVAAALPANQGPASPRAANQGPAAPRAASQGLAAARAANKAPAAHCRTSKGCRAAEPIRAVSKPVTSSGNGSKAARTVTAGPAPQAPPTAADRTVAAVSALAGAGSTAQARTRTITTTQPKAQPARTCPHTNTESKVRSNKAIVGPSAQVKTCANTITSARASHVQATMPKTGLAAPGLSKLGSSKAPPARPVSTAPAPRVPSCPVVTRPGSGPARPRSQCNSLQNPATGQTCRSIPVLRRTEVKTTIRSKLVQQEQGFPKATKVPLNKPPSAAAKGPAPQPVLQKQSFQPPQPDLKAAARRQGRTGSRSLVPASRAGDASDGQQVRAIQRAVRQAVTEMRKEGGGRVRGEGAAGNPAMQNWDGPAPVARATFTRSNNNGKPRCSALRKSSEVLSTVPQPTRQSCLPAAAFKTPVRTGPPETGPGLIGTVPPQDRKMTAAQEERLKRLAEWRQSRGITYKRPPMPVRLRRKTTTAVPQHYWTTMEEEDEAQSLVYNIDHSLSDCIRLLQEGCTAEQVKEVLSGVPMAKKFAKYWICQVRLMEREGDLEVLPVFEEAVREVLEPVDDLRAVVFEVLKKKEEASAAEEEAPLAVSEDERLEGEEEEDEEADALDPVTPRATCALIRGAKDGSSVVKYKITATPGGRQSQQLEPLTLDGQEVRFFTPVRRSVRIERSAPRYPAALREHDPCVASFQDLLAEEEGEVRAEEEGQGVVCGSPVYVYRENEALKDQVQLQLC